MTRPTNEPPQDITGRLLRRTKLGDPLLAKVTRRDEGEQPKIGGLAAVYYDGSEGTEFRLWDDYRERILPGAFDDVMDDDVVCLENHSPHYVLGRTSAGTLRLSLDERGLRYECDPPRCRADTVESVERGDVTGCSFAFEAGETRVTEISEGNATVYIREIVRFARLIDVGPVTFPAYTATEVDVRCREEARGAMRRQRNGGGIRLRSALQTLRERG